MQNHGLIQHSFHLFHLLQITTLVNHRERPCRSERTRRALLRVGQAVNLAVERFVTVGEAIAADNTDIQQDMCQACKEARLAGRVDGVVNGLID